MNFNDFVSELTQLDATIDLSPTRKTALDAKPSTVDGYVTPTFKLNLWPENAAVVLVEAPGAVGKTSAATAIAERVCWPLVRAEKAQVGSYTLSGLVLGSVMAAGQFIENLREGQAGIIVDSLDEAHFRAGTQNFLEFLEDIKVLSNSSELALPRPPSIVLMSRSDTAELIRLSFADSNLPLADVELDFFDYASSTKFILSYMGQRFRATKRPEYNVPLAAPGPFEKIRHYRFTQIATLLLNRKSVDLAPEWPEAKDFLGYAPVLIALAESLAVNNPSRKLLPGSEADSGTLLLHEIIESILERERVKFGTQLFDQLQAALPASVDEAVTLTDLYSSSEQSIRLASYVTRDDLRTPPPYSLPSAVRDLYEQAANQFVVEHPFIRSGNFASVVFSDYVSARLCLDPLAAVALNSPPVTNVRDVGPFFARFIAHQSSPENSVPLAESLVPPGIPLAESLVEPVISSWNQEGELSPSVSRHARLLMTEEESRLELLIGDQVIYELELEKSSGALQIERGFKNASLVSDQGIILGTRSSTLLLGPEVFISAKELVFESESLSVQGADNSGHAVVISADDLVANYLHTVESQHGRFKVFSSAAPPRLRPFLQSLNNRTRTIPYSDYVDLRSIMTAFRPSANAGPAVLAEKIDKAIVKDNAARKRLLGQLIHMGAVVLNSPYYRIDLTVLASLKININDFKGGDPGDAVLQFLSACRYDDV